MHPDKFYAGHYTSSEFNDKISSGKGVIITCGSCEQHGYHLPLDTDNILGFEIGSRIAEKTGLLLMPPINYGQVWSAKGFPGTISLTPGTLKQLLKEIICSLEAQNVANIVLMSGHNGNFPILKELARELRDEFNWTNIWHFPMAFSKELAAEAKTPSAMLGHAGEEETSMLLYLRPELVHLSLATQEFPQPPVDYPYRPVHWNEFVKTGSFGDSRSADPEYGRRLVEYAVETTAALINHLLK